MKALPLFEMPQTVGRTKQRRISKVWHIQQHGHENIK
jgi:hypothetical protein